MGVLDKATTGLPGLDEILQNLRRGDNVVWQVDSIDDYIHFVFPFIKQALADNKRLVYIRFAKHRPILPQDDRIKVYNLDASTGFESFSKEIHEIITKEGDGVYYVFDCLSDLLLAWATDLMIGNFFMVTCPYLFKLNTIAYFAILRNNHSFKTIARIRETTQLLLDVYDFEDKFYVHPLKVWNRYSPTMFLPHVEDKDKYLPIINSSDAARLFAYMSQGELAEGIEESEKQEMFDHLNKIMIGREARMLGLVKENFTLDDLLNIKSRMIGTGYIGGKALGMLLARKILSKDKDENWQEKLEPHDSFYIGSDVFYSYIVENGWWELWLEQKTEAGYFDKAQILKEKMLKGEFPDEIKEQFHQMIEYFGQSPIIARSSSLLEDSFGNAFAGKYESIFCVNQGTPEQRYKNFENIVRQIYASTMDEEALIYRLQRGLNRMDEQMALLVQRVSGSRCDKYYFPFLAGVAVSYNTFVWHEKMDPKAGMMRLVFGLGTRAVNRVEGDYPRIVAIDNPLLKPYSGMANEKKFSQHEVDLLNIKKNELETVSLEKLLQDEKNINLDLIGKRDDEAQKKLKELGQKGQAWVLTFDKLLSKTEFLKDMKKILNVLHKAYEYPVDVEFTVNFNMQDKMQINLLQCRPLQAKGISGKVEIPTALKRDQVLFESFGGFMGGNVSQSISEIIYVDPEIYGDLLMNEKYEVARIIGRINKLIDRKTTQTLLIGPGRWGTRDPSLGVPVKFAEINNVSALVEIDDPAHGFTPELSFGSHFFLDLVEAEIFYAALFLGRDNVFFNKIWLEGLKNELKAVIPEAASFQNVLKVIRFNNSRVRLLSDITAQKTVCLK